MTLSDEINRWNVMLMKTVPLESVKQSIKTIKNEWKLKMKRLKVISVDVAILELNLLIDREVGEELI